MAPADDDPARDGDADPPPLPPMQAAASTGAAASTPASNPSPSATNTNHDADAAAATLSSTAPPPSRSPSTSNAAGPQQQQQPPQQQQNGDASHHHPSQPSVDILNNNNGNSSHHYAGSLPPATSPPPPPQNAASASAAAPAPAAPHHPVSYLARATASPSPSAASPAHAGPQPASYSHYGATSTSTPPPQQSADGHRLSQSGPNSVTLPSMRTIDAMSQQPQQQPPQHHHQQQHQAPQPAPHHSVNVPLAPGSPAGSGSYYSHTTYGLPSDLARYPIPHDPRLAGSRGPKKEIKRRTKTGCLTCRKRRIKCDEAHPTCNNCRKSKRDCLGYDPIFRQQAGNQPASNLQPAPSARPVAHQTASPASAAARPPNSYGHSSAVSSYAPSQPSSATPSVASPGYQPNSTAASTSAAPTIKSEPRYPYSYSTNSPGALYANPAYDSSRPSPEQNRLPPIEGHHHQRPTKMKIHEIIDSLGQTPPPPQVTPSAETLAEITRVYHEMYAAALASFFETTWYYFVEDGKMSFPKDPRLVEHMASFLKILEAVKANDHTQMAYSGILETRIVWELARTVYQTPERSNGAMRMSLPPEGDSAEARNRLQVVEALLCGEYLGSNPLSPPVTDSDVQRSRQFDFWYCLADFVRHRDGPESPQAAKAREDVLARMRHLLDGRENRDVLYSIAVVRHLAPNFEPGFANSNPQHLDETDPKSRLVVASRFIMDESQVTGGTTNVVRRFSDIASRAFVNPGVNVDRRT